MSRISGCMNDVYHQIVRGKMCDCGIKDVIRYILASDYNIQDNIVEQMCTETIPQYSKNHFVIKQYSKCKFVITQYSKCQFVITQ